MLNNRTSLVGGIIVLLLIANILNYFWSNWGLITIHAKDQPLGKVLKSIEWQGWVTIYSNIDPNSKITMDCDHVPLPEAMETLAANVDDDSGGGFRGGAQWHLGFFVAPSSADVKQEIRTFTEGADSSDDTHIYSYPTPLAMVADDTMPVADPRRQVWPGLKLPPAPPAPPADAAADATDPAAVPAPEPPPSSVQGYLRAFARQADVWIMAPANWDPPVQNPPPADSSIVAAIRHFVGSAHGSVREALVLRGRPPRVAGERPRGENRGGGFDVSMMSDRMDNAINGLPVDVQPAARANLAQEMQFQKEMANLPPEQRFAQMRKHMMDKRLDNDNNWRRSPEKRAQMYARMVQNRVAATGK